MEIAIVLSILSPVMFPIFRCVLDTMRFIDLLLVLVFEGRDALPKTATNGGITSRAGSGAKLDSSGERSHRQLIDCIRSKDTDALIEAVDSGSKLSLSGYLMLCLHQLLRIVCKMVVDGCLTWCLLIYMLLSRGAFYC